MVEALVESSATHKNIKKLNSLYRKYKTEVETYSPIYWTNTIQQELNFRELITLKKSNIKSLEKILSQAIERKKNSLQDEISILNFEEFGHQNKIHNE